MALTLDAKRDCPVCGMPLILGRTIRVPVIEEMTVAEYLSTDLSDQAALAMKNSTLEVCKKECVKILVDWMKLRRQKEEREFTIHPCSE